MNDLLLGIDLGTTFLKAAVFKKDGSVVAVCGQKLRVITGPDGKREQNVDELLDVFKKLMSSLCQQCGREWKNISGIGLAAQGGSTCIVNRETGKPFMPMILWNDTRAFSYYPQVKKNRPPAFWRRHTMRDDPGMGLARMLWLRETKPHLFKSTNIYSGAGEYFYFLLTGKWRQDAGNALQTGCYNAHRMDIDDELLAIAGVNADFVAPMRKGHELHPLIESAAKKFGLKSGIPVAGPYMDHEAGYLSSVSAGKSPLQISLGTAWVGNVMLKKNDKWHSPYQLVLPGITKEGWLVVQPLLAGNIVLDWALENFIDSDHKKALMKLPEIFKEDIFMPQGIIAFPWLNRPNPFNNKVIGGGFFTGVNLSLRKEDIYKMLAAGLCFELKRVFDDVCRMKKCDCIVMGGGASKGMFFQKIISALFAPVPLYIYQEADLSGSRGALYALSRVVARARIKKVISADKSIVDAANCKYMEYMDMMKLIFKNCPAGEGIVFSKEK